MSKSKLPSLAELANDLKAYAKADELNYLLNQEPPAAWIKKHPIIKKELPGGRRAPLEYLPIDKIEYLLRRIFKKYKIEVLQVNQLFNAVQVTVRVHYLDLTSGEWLYHDGVGAWNVQLNKGATGESIADMKQAAVVMATPLAKTLAIKDACHLFGSLFGANLNRADVDKARLDKEVQEANKNSDDIKLLEYHLNKCKTQQDVERIEHNFMSAAAEGQVAIDASILFIEAYKRVNNNNLKLK